MLEELRRKLHSSTRDSTERPHGPELVTSEVSWGYV
jgi:hypothetical protein